MKIESEEINAGHMKVRIIGEMTVYHASQLKQDLLAQLSDAEKLEIDLSDTSEIDTAGLQVLIMLKNESSASDKQLQLTDHSQPVTDILEFSHLNTFFAMPGQESETYVQG